jgi:hypothetical protein
MYAPHRVECHTFVEIRIAPSIRSASNTDCVKGRSEAPGRRPLAAAGRGTRAAGGAAGAAFTGSRRLGFEELDDAVQIGPQRCGWLSLRNAISRELQHFLVNFADLFAASSRVCCPAHYSMEIRHAAQIERAEP